MTIIVIVIFVERIFFKLKLIKSYLRLTMSQERINGLTILLIENEMLKELKYKNLRGVSKKKTYSFNLMRN